MRAIFLSTVASLVSAQVRRPTKPEPIDIDKEYPKIPNEYIVVLHPEASDGEFHEHLQGLQGTDAVLKFKYNGTKQFRGYSMRVQDPDAGSAIKYVRARTADSYQKGQEVHYMEQNGVAKANGPKDVCNTQEQATWGLVRVSQKDLDIDGLFSHSTLPDTSAKAYVLDTGIYRSNVEFGGRAIFGADFTTSQPPMTDLAGHGTHCAGTIMGKTYGLVKDGIAVDVRVLGADGSGSFDGVIAGIDFVAADGKGGRSVGSMSLGGGKYQAVNDAVDAAVDNGVTMVVAAGNDAMNSCLFSPASASKAITVMCSDRLDSMCYFSNYGSCSDIIAPGYQITSAWIGSPVSQNTISGTSMSTPHVAGAALRILASANYKLSPAEVKAQLLDTGTKGIITEIMGGNSTPNVLLHQLCEGKKPNPDLLV